MIDNQELLAALSTDLVKITHKAQGLLSCTEQELNASPAPGKWSVAQVVAHLSYYNTLYLPRIRKAIEQEHAKATAYKPGWLGNYFTRLMSPLPDGQLPAKMKAPAASRPIAQQDAHRVLQEFLQQQSELAALIQQAAGAHLGKIRIATSISSLIRLKLGDTFRFLVAHQQRHFVQIAHVLQDTGAGKTIINA